MWYLSFIPEHYLSPDITYILEWSITSQIFESSKELESIEK